ncbi:Ionotropic receptor 171 [Frankliniella occidentalis]|nr:Ionotropic receptor 171 [Frankliniella occidentalis]
MKALLVLPLLCCAFAVPGVRAELPVVDLAVPAEARSAAALLTRYMQSQNATLVVVGRAHWTGAFLGELPDDVPRVLNPSVLAPQPRIDPRLEHTLKTTRCAYLIPVDGLENLLVTLGTYEPTTLPTRILFWATVAAPRGAVLRLIASASPSVWLTRHHYDLALSARDGSTALYHLVCDQSAAACRDGAKTITDTDTWSPVEGRWRRGVAVFDEFCSDWRLRRGKSRELTVFVFPGNGVIISPPLLELTKSLQHVEAGRRRRISEATVRYANIVEYRPVRNAMKECSLAAVLGDGSLFPEYTSVEETIVPGMEMTHIGVIVPAGLGAFVSVLDSVTVEFSAMLWCATGLAALCTVVVLTCAQRQDVSGAVLQALAPMVGQAPPTPAPPRPMLGAWLLACVVLTAAYQGLLLGKLFSAVPRRDLESLQDLEDSGLPLKVHRHLSHSNVLTDNLASRAEYVLYSEVVTTIDTIATARNCALVTFLDAEVINSLRPLLLPPKRLHVIRLPYLGQNIVGMATKGSPLAQTMIRTLGLVEAAGLLARWRYEQYQQELLDRHRKQDPLREPRVLALRHLYPAFIVLGVGHAAAVAAFALEALSAWRARLPSPSRRVGS